MKEQITLSHQQDPVGKSSRVTKGDVLVIIIAFAIVLSVFTTLWRNDGYGAEAVVLIDGQRWARLNLFQNQDIKVPGQLGVSLLQVRDGQVRFMDSPCSNKICIHTGWIRQGGETATCLPNRVSLQVLGSNPRFDSINF